MDQALFDTLQQSLQTDGPAAAVDRLCASLRASGDYAKLFYALLMKKRVELGISPIPTGPSSEVPDAVVAPYEDAIRAAAREVGALYLDRGNLIEAWPYFRMIGEPQAVAAAMEAYQLPEDGDACAPIIELAFHGGVHPRLGFDWLLQRYGICSAITVLTGQLGNPQFPHGPEARDHCIQSLIRALYDQLLERLRQDVTNREGALPPGQTIPDLLAGRDWLMAENNYHVDTSHLSSVVHMGVHLSKCPELRMLRELCAYGEKLSPQFQHRGEPPFEDAYRDYGVFYRILDGDGVDAGLDHFRAKAANPDPDYPLNPAAETLVNLLLRIDRPAEALEAAAKYLADVDERQLSCPSIQELCRRVDDYRPLAAVSRLRGDPVHFIAGLLASKK